MKDDIRYRKYNIGDFTYGKPKIFEWGEGTALTIGRFCSISSGVKILLGGNHRTDWLSTYPFPKFFNDCENFHGYASSKGDVCIGNDVWIGMDAIVLSGVAIGDGAVIAARAVCTKDVPPYAIVAGNPARIIRFRFDDDVIAALMKICWWDWPEVLIKKSVPIFMQNDINELIKWSKGIEYHNEKS